MKLPMRRIRMDSRIAIRVDRINMDSKTAIRVDRI